MIRLHPKRNADPAVGAAGSFKSKAPFAPHPTRIVIAGFHRFRVHRSACDEPFDPEFTAEEFNRIGLVAMHSS